MIKNIDHAVPKFVPKLGEEPLRREIPDAPIRGSAWNTRLIGVFLSWRLVHDVVVWPVRVMRDYLTHTARHIKKTPRHKSLSATHSTRVLMLLHQKLQKLNTH